MAEGKTCESPQSVMLNSFQHPFCDLAAAVLAEKWTLKQVQGDEAVAVL